MSRPEHVRKHRRRHHRKPAPARRRGAGPIRSLTAGVIALGGFGLLIAVPLGAVMVAHAYPQWNEQSGIAQLAPLGTEVRDGDVTFVVHRVDCAEVSSDEARHGRQCEVTIGARNEGDEPVTIPGAVQHLGGPEGARHLPLPDDPEPWGTLEPGEEAAAAIAYDLPPEVPLTHVVVFGEMHSRGQAVALPR